MTVAGYLRRRKRDLDLLAADPGAEKLCSVYITPREDLAERLKAKK